MANETTAEQLEKLAQDLLDIAKILDCSVGLDIHLCEDGSCFGTFWKIKERAIDFHFDEEQINLARALEDDRHLFAYKEDECCE